MPRERQALEEAGQLQQAMAAFQGNLIQLIDYLAARDREGQNRENRAAIFIHMVYLSLIGMCIFNWIWQNYIRPELTIPLGRMNGRLDHIEDLFSSQNDILDNQGEELK